MPSVNLIPHELLLRRCKIRRVRTWLIIGGVTWIFASIPVIRELSAEYQLNSQSTAVAAMSDQLDHAHARRGQSAKRLLMLHQEVARAEKLRYKRLWTDMISVIADAIPERVWLIQLSTDPAKPPVSARTTAPLSPRRSAGSKVATTTPAGYDTLVGKAGRGACSWRVRPSDWKTSTPSSMRSMTWASSKTRASAPCVAMWPALVPAASR